MSDLFSSLLIFTIIKTILSTFFLLFLNFTKERPEMLCSVVGTTTLDANTEATWLSAMKYLCHK